MSETDVGREPVIYVQIDQDLCQETYGVAPCTAEVGVTGERKCFNTRQTCQDPGNYNRGSLTLTFSRPDQNIGVDGLYVMPFLSGDQPIDTTPTELNPGGGSQDSSPLGSRATCSISFQDAPHSDNVVDPYRTERSYIATDRGTFWSKWLARNPYYNNRTMRIYEGYQGQTLADMQVRTYLIDSISGPSSSGRVTVKGKDVLKLADNEKAVAPAASEGELIVDINDTTTADLRVTGADAADYPAPGTVRIGDELIGFTGVTTIDSEEINLTGITRATDGSEADDHDAEDVVQLCLRYTDTRVDDIAYDLLTTYAGVSTSFIDQAAWDEEAATWLVPYTFTTIISEPTGVLDLLGEITEQALFYIWWDERAQLIRLAAIKPLTDDPVVFTDENHILADSSRLQTKPKDRISQVWVYWGQSDPTQDLDEESNFTRRRIRADLSAESDEQYGEQQIRRIYSRWVTSGSQAANTAFRILNRYRNNPRYLDISVDAKDRANWTGGIVDVSTRGVVDDTGSPLTTRWQIISADEAESAHRIDYTLALYEYGADKRFAYIVEDGAADYPSTAVEDRDPGCWIAQDDGTMINGDNPYLLV